MKIYFVSNEMKLIIFEMFNNSELLKSIAIKLSVGKTRKSEKFVFYL